MYLGFTLLANRLWQALKTKKSTFLKADFFLVGPWFKKRVTVFSDRAAANVLATNFTTIT